MKLYDIANLLVFLGMLLVAIMWAFERNWAAATYHMLFAILLRLNAIPWGEVNGCATVDPDKKTR